MLSVYLLISSVIAVTSQTYEGAFAQGPGLEAHGIEQCCLL